jgi:hypothetical protein
MCKTNLNLSQSPCDLTQGQRHNYRLHVAVSSQALRLQPFLQREDRTWLGGEAGVRCPLLRVTNLTQSTTHRAMAKDEGRCCPRCTQNPRECTVALSTEFHVSTVVGRQKQPLAYFRWHPEIDCDHFTDVSR